ncbi:Protein kintoun [Rhizophlyctis rosea]|uniref:Protein kintoun n=1 Tax=Rhizophlyctis rosea TaxID=64517 RepID=A0AAD5WZQ8_9FUNG|nr:Protein kintoun [Rhizophlyctis rosea]
MMASSEGAKPKFEPTQEEFKRIEESMKDDQFKKLFFEYMNEISDPENRKLYEAELTQLEAERGNNVRFVNPEPGFVVKTFTPTSTPSETEKLFINICSSPEIAIASVSGKNAKGQNWSIPYTLSAGREDVDHANNKCTVYDCVFHPDTLKRANDSIPFRNMLISTAMEGVEKQFKIQIDKKFKLPKLKSKGPLGQTVIRTSAPQPPSTSTSETSVEFLDRLKREQQSESKPPSTPSTKSPLIQEIPSPKSSEPTQESKPVEVTPRFSIVHRGVNDDYQKYTNERNRMGGTRPDVLVVRVELPGVFSAGAVTLDTTEKDLDLHVPDKYKLHLPLPFSVVHEKGSAKFDKGKQTLTVTLPVVPPPVVDVPTPNVPVEISDETDVPGADVESSVVLAESDTANADDAAPRLPTLEDGSDTEADLKTADGYAEDVKAVNVTKADNVEESTSTHPSTADQKTSAIPAETSLDALDWIVPLFTLRQDLETASFIISVPDVDEANLISSFDETMITIKFRDSNNNHYNLTLQTPSPINSSKCSVDISNENVAVVVWKVADGLWDGVKVVGADGEKSVRRFLTRESVRSVGVDNDEDEDQAVSVPSGPVTLRQRDDGAVEVHFAGSETKESVDSKPAAEVSKDGVVGENDGKFTREEKAPLSVADNGKSAREEKAPLSAAEEAPRDDRQKSSPAVKLLNPLIYALDD